MKILKLCGVHTEYLDLGPSDAIIHFPFLFFKASRIPRQTSSARHVGRHVAVGASPKVALRWAFL